MSTLVNYGTRGIKVLNPAPGGAGGQGLNANFQAIDDTLAALQAAVAGCYTQSQVDTIAAAKANKVVGATAGNFASLTAGGDLQDSGKSTGSFDTAGAAAGVQTNLTTHASRIDNPHAVTAAQAGAYTTAQVDAIAAAKAGKVVGATAGHLASLSAGGDLQDSGHPASDFAPGGTDNQVQYNVGGAFTGSDGLTFDPAAGTLSVGAPTNPFAFGLKVQSPNGGASFEGDGDTDTIFDIYAASAAYSNSMLYLHTATTLGGASGSKFLDCRTDDGATQVFSLGGDGTLTTIGPASASNLIQTIRLTLDGGGSTITTGTKGGLCEFAPGGTIVGYTLLAEGGAVGSISIDLKKGAYNAARSSITAANPCVITSSDHNQDNTLSGWSKTVNARDVFEAVVNSASGFTGRVTLSLRIKL